MRKTVLVLLAVLLMAAACSSNDGDGPSATPDTSPDPETAVAESSDPDPAVSVADLSALVPVAFRPAYDPAGDPAVYLHGLVVWELETGPDTVPDERTVSARRASECYAGAFVSVLGPERHTDVAGELAMQGLLDGFPLDIVTDAERDRLYIRAAPCLDDAWLADLAASEDPQPMLDIPGTFTEEQQTTLTIAFERCLGTLLAADNSKEWFLELALFDSLVAEQQLGVALWTVCRESYLVPMLIEQLVASGYDRATAECASPPVAALMGDSVAGYADLPVPEHDVYDPEAEAAMMTEMFTIMTECGMPEGFLQ